MAIVENEAAMLPKTILGMNQPFQAGPLKVQFIEIQLTIPAYISEQS